MTEDYDIIMIGSGVAGKVLSWTLASRGKRVAVVERKYVGGSCPNIACLPSKNVVHSAKIATYLRDFGGRIDMTTVRERKRTMVDSLVAAHLQKFQASGAELVMGTGRFVAPKTIEVNLNAGGTRTLRGANVVINTGSRARIDDTPGLRDARPLPPSRLWNWTAFPITLSSWAEVTSGSSSPRPCVVSAAE
jgi:pyruvate/2-oxoglutarate dehydrogenase complex dihydrolipoamide dehydrogenase (E3) component